MHNAERSHTTLLELIEKNPSLNLQPLVELVVEETPDYLEAFCNQAIFSLSELLRDDQQGGVFPERVMQIIHQLHSLREAFRQVRGATAWP
jgi:hypothetical protein